jgi:hypothetical protein
MSVDSINAFSVVLARFCGALVEVDLAVLAFKSGGALAGV